MNLLPEKMVWPSGYAVKAQGKGWRNCGSNSPPPPSFFPSSSSSSVTILMERKWKWMQPGKPNTVTVTATFKLIQLIIIHNPVWSFQQGQVTFNFLGQITIVNAQELFLFTKITVSEHNCPGSRLELDVLPNGSMGAAWNLQATGVPDVVWSPSSL